MSPSGWLGRPWAQAALLVAVGAGLFIVLPGGAPLDGDPAMWAAIARTIDRTGDWLHLSFNGAPYLNKPPLFFWLVAPCLRLFGVGEASASLVSGVFGILDMLLLWTCGRRMLGSEAIGLATALVFATTHEVVHWTRGVHLETLVVFWNLLGLLAVHASLRDRRAMAWLGIVLAGGFLAKGPQGLFPAAAALVAWSLDGSLGARLRSREARIGAGAFALLVVPWLAAQLLGGRGFAETYLVDQVGGVLFGTEEKPRPADFYAGKLLQTYWPWLPFAVAGAVLLGRRRRGPGALIWLAYATTVALVITAASVRKTRYLFPLYPALAMFSGVAIDALRSRLPRIVDALAAAALAGALAAAVIFGVFSAQTQERDAETLAKRADAMEIARRLPPDARLWLARGIGIEQSFGVGKVLAFYAEPLACDCAAACSPPGTGPVRVVGETGDADAIAAELGGSVDWRGSRLAIVSAPDGADVRGTTCVGVAEAAAAALREFRRRTWERR